jgi:hypothetical protein
VATGATTTGESEPETTEDDGQATESRESEQSGGSDAAASLREQIASDGRSKASEKVPSERLELPETGVEAWSGCDEPDDDLTIDELVEAQFEG